MRNEAQLCPVCCGSGEVPDRVPKPRETGMRPCHGCEGKGWVVVEQPGPMDGVRVHVGLPDAEKLAEQSLEHSYRQGDRFTRELRLQLYCQKCGQWVCDKRIPGTDLADAGIPWTEELNRHWQSCGPDAAIQGGPVLLYQKGS